MWIFEYVEQLYENLSQNFLYGLTHEKIQKFFSHVSAWRALNFQILGHRTTAIQFPSATQISERFPEHSGREAGHENECVLLASHVLLNTLAQQVISTF